MESPQTPIEKNKEVILQRQIRGGLPITKIAPPASFGEEGELCLRDDQGTPVRTYYLYAKINGAWRLIGSVT